MISYFFFLFVVLCDSLDVGILYEVWHTKSAQAMARQPVQYTTELVIQSAGNVTLDDVFSVGQASDIFNVMPELGFYCIYRARPGQTAPVPDCSNISATLSAHANLLSSANVDYVTVDVTNWPNTDVGGSTDISVLRPTEVLFEEWAKLRASGTQTPQITVWPCSPKGSNTWSYLLDTLYNNASYSELIWRMDGKLAMFIPFTPNCYDAATVALIESNSGLNNVVVIPMWALFGDGGGGGWMQGVWGFFSPCTDAHGDFTTSIIGGLSDSGTSPCNQYSTLRNQSKELFELSASGGYMLSQCALPFASPGHFRGLTLARLFEKILDVSPPHVFISSFNEHIGGRQDPASRARIAFNMGLPNDPQRDVVWVDTYASEFSRDIEPTVEGGRRTWNTAVSCISMYKEGKTCDVGNPSLCCTRNDKEIFSNVWSLARVDGGDYLASSLLEEKMELVASGNWSELCSPIPNPTAFCVDTKEMDGSAGPFILYSQSETMHPKGDSEGLFPTAPLYRCSDELNHQHFLSRDAGCEELGKAEKVIGYVALIPGWEMLRALYRCFSNATGGAYLHSLDVPCKFPDHRATPALGYVR